MIATPATAPPIGARENAIEGALPLLERALALLDESDQMADFGARLDEIIQNLKMLSR